MRNTIKELDKFMDDAILFKEYVIFNRKEDVGGIEDCGIEEVYSMGREEGRVDMLRIKERCRSGLGGRCDRGGQERHTDL